MGVQKSLYDFIKRVDFFPGNGMDIAIVSMVSGKRGAFRINEGDMNKTVAEDMLQGLSN